MRVGTMQKLFQVWGRGTYARFGDLRQEAIMKLKRTWILLADVLNDTARKKFLTAGLLSPRVWKGSWFFDRIV